MNVPSLVSGSFADNFYPFSLTRSVADFRIGIMTIREKWHHYFKNIESFPSEIVIPANIIPNQELFQSLFVSVVKADWDKAVRILQLPDILAYNGPEIKNDFELITRGRETMSVSATNKVQGSAIFLEPGSIVEHSFLNATEGPIYIGKNAVIMEGSMIRGPFSLGEQSVVKMGAKIYGATTIGPHCIMGGEIKNSVIFGYSNKAHDGYLGDSVIGEWCNLGGGSTNSNMKNSGGDVKLWNPLTKTYLNAGLKCGLMMGDYCRSAINTSFQTGTVAGPASHIFGNRPTPSYLPSFSWGYDHVEYDFDKAVEHIGKWKKLKGRNLSQEEIILLKNIFDQKN